MRNLNIKKEKNTINFNQNFLNENNSINKNSFYQIYNIQNLYDITSLKNGINIDLAADLIYKAKNIKLFIDKNKNEKILFTKICNSFKLLGLNFCLYDIKNKLIPLSDDTIFINYSINCNNLPKNLKIINILSESEKNKKNNNDLELNLYYMECLDCEKTLCIEILFRCLYLGVLTKTIS